MSSDFNHTMRHIIILGLLFCYTVTFGQETARDWYQKSVNFFDQGSYQNALDAAGQAATYYQEVGDIENTIICHALSGKCFVRIGDINQALTTLESIEKLHKDGQSISPNALAEVKNLEGEILLNQGQTEGAIEAFEAAVGTYEQHELTTKPEYSQSLTNLGLAYWNSGNTNRARGYLESALQKRKETYGEDHELVAGAYNNLGLIFSTENPETALDYYERAFEVYKKIHDGDHPSLAIAHNNMALANLGMEFYGDASNHFNEALKIWMNLYPDGHPNVAFTLNGIAETNKALNDLDGARRYYNDALKMYMAYYGPRHPSIANVYNNLGSLQLSESMHLEAIKSFHKALIANSTEFSNEEYLTNPKPDDYLNPELLLASLLLKAQALEARHLAWSLSRKEIQTSMTTLEIGITLADKIRQTRTSEQDKIALARLSSELYEDAVRVSYYLGQINFRSSPFEEKAFLYSEKSKSAVLQESIAEVEARSFANIPQEMIEEEKSLKGAIAYLEQQIARSSGDNQNLRSELFDKTRAYEQFIENLENSFPEYYELKYASTTPTISVIQKTLSANQLLVSYFIAEKENQLYIFSVGKNHFRLDLRPLEENFDRYISGFRNSIYFEIPEVYKLTGTTLHDQLIPSKIPSGITELVVIPQGRLGVIPFEALLTEVTTTEFSFHNAPYLLKKYSVLYHYSTPLFLQAKAKVTNRENKSALLMAPVNFSVRAIDLPATEQEVISIGAMLASNAWEPEVKTFENATNKFLLESNLKDYRILHLATHGLVDEKTPALSRIFLHPASSENEGYLFSGDIFNLSLDAELVTLSACQTALGQLVKGEGIIGLSRALLYAGANNLVVSLWNVGDRSTAMLMTNFYESSIQNDAEVFGSELQKAKLDMIRNSAYASPYYWAPFILIGK